MVKRIILGACLLLTVAACNGKKDADNVSPTDAFDRRAMLANYADNIIKPGYASLKTSFDVMKTQSDNFLNNPTEDNLSKFREAWKDTYVEWQKVEMFEVGPAEEVMLRSNFNIYPFNITVAEANINSGSYNFDEAGQIASKGLPALDYFLNGTGTGDGAIVLWFNDAAKGNARKKYIRDVINHMSDRLNTVVTSWNGNFRDQFVNNSGTDAASSTAKLVNAYVLYYERFVRSGKIGIPAGIMGTSLISPSPEKVEAFYKRDLSRELAITAHQAVMDLYRGKSFSSSSTGASFKTYFAALGTKGANGSLTAEILDEQFGKAAARLNETQPDFYQQIQIDRNKMIAVFEEMQLAVRLIKLDMTSAMGISISYTDNDGD